MKIKSDLNNRLKYVSFTDQIAKVSVDIARWHLTVAAAPSAENETHFNDAITKYQDLDYGSYFESFLNDIQYFNGELRTYAQLLHRKDVVAKALINHLNIAENTSLNTTLELTIAFVQDIREDFQNYVWEFIEAIIGILERSHENREILQTAFFTVAKIFWLQRRHLVYQLHEVFRRFKRILCCKRSYLRRFTAEALAFLLRKSNSVVKFTIFLAETAHNEVDNSLLIDGISRLYFNALKITRGQFYSTAPQLLSEILQASFEIEENDVRNTAIQILIYTMYQCSTYTSKEYSELLVDVILKRYELAMASLDIVKSSALAKLLNAWISQKMGRSLHKPSSLFQVIIDGAKSKVGVIDRETIGLLTTAIMRYHSDSELRDLIITAVRTFMSDEKCGFDVILDFLYEISSIPLFDIWIMPIVGTFMSRFVSKVDAQIISRIFRFYADLCSKRRPIWKYKERRDCFFDICNHLEVRNRLIDILKSADIFDAEIVGCCLMTYPWLWNQSEKPKEIDAVFRILITSMNTLESVDARLSLLAANACLSFNPSLFKQFTLDTLLIYYKNMGNNEAALRTLSLILPFIGDSEKLKNVSAMSKVANEILPMFGHWSSYVRQVALEVLTHFHIPVNENNINEKTVEVESAFYLLLRCERIPWTLEEYRTRLMILRQLTYGAHAKHMPKGFDLVLETIPLRVIIGNLYEPFTIAWNELKNIIQDYAYGLSIDAFFSVFLPFVDQMGSKNQFVIYEKSDSSNYDVLDKMTIIADRSPRNYGTFRLEMLGILSRISDLCERRTKLLSPLFIRFFRFGVRKSEDDGKRIKEEECIGRKLVRNSLIAFLDMFANFTSPKTIYMANEIRDLYDEERTLISNLVRFSIDDCNSVIDSNHRSGVMQIVLRLLYGKCNIHCKKDMSEKRAAIFRFLAGCEERSLEIFCKQTISTFDVSSMVPLQIIKGFAFSFVKCGCFDA
uniref:DRIM domain-containing protein n=1 Tax=Elaeophora elaphi TaxID=1147741 RepID=A0A0R3RU84_9BILA